MIDCMHALMSLLDLYVNHAFLIYGLLFFFFLMYIYIYPVLKITGCSSPFSPFICLCKGVQCAFRNHEYWVGA